MKLKLMLLILALSLTAVAQTTKSLPGVTLSGPLDDLTITNNSTKPILAALVLYFGADGKEQQGHDRTFIIDRPNYLAVGDFEKIGTFKKGKGAEHVVSVKVAAVIFSDGEFRGEDDREAIAFRRHMEEMFQSIRSVFQFAQGNNWAEVKALYDADTKGDFWKTVTADSLLRVHDTGGDIKSLKHYGDLPINIWKGNLLNKLRAPETLQALSNWLSDWFSPTVYAQNHTFCCTAPWPQGTGTDGYHPTQWSYYCSDTNQDIPCPPNMESTDWEGISATCTAIPPAFAYTTGMKMSLAQDLQGHTWFQITASSQSGSKNQLDVTTSCHDLRLLGYQAEYSHYYKYCEDVTTAAPHMEYDTTQYICGAQKLGYVN